MKAPPGLSAKDYSHVIKQWAEIVGKERVFTSDEDVEMYRDYYSPLFRGESTLLQMTYQRIQA